MTDHQPLPVAGYVAQPQANVDLVNRGKELEERVMRWMDDINSSLSVTPDLRSLALGRSFVQTGFMWAARSIFNPQRIKLPEDVP